MNIYLLRKLGYLYANNNEKFVLNIPVFMKITTLLICSNQMRIT